MERQGRAGETAKEMQWKVPCTGSERSVKRHGTVEERECKTHESQCKGSEWQCTGNGKAVQGQGMAVQGQGKGSARGKGKAVEGQGKGSGKAVEWQCKGSARAIAVAVPGRPFPRQLGLRRVLATATPTQCAANERQRKGSERQYKAVERQRNTAPYLAAAVAAWTLLQGAHPGAGQKR